MENTAAQLTILAGLGYLGYVLTEKHLTPSVVIEMARHELSAGADREYGRAGENWYETNQRIAHKRIAEPVRTFDSTDLSIGTSRPPYERQYTAN